MSPRPRIAAFATVQRKSRLPELLLLLLLAQPAAVQSQQHEAHQFGFSADSVGIIAESTPLDDSILTLAPQQLALSFSQNVRLVKLVLYDNRRDWVDIGFRYDPLPNQQFALAIPGLQESDYYTASWAILDQQERLIRGSFSFTFGTGKLAPSQIMAQEQLLLEAGNLVPDFIRLQRLGNEPAEFKFSDRDQPAFEEPFAPVLGQPPQ